MSSVGRIGIVGTSWWVEGVHGKAAAASPDWDLTAVYGRSPDKAAAIATTLGCQPFSDLDAFLDAVDAVVFSVPPTVQVEIATRAAKAGKHLLLEKPLALDPQSAQQLVTTIEDSGVAAVVFFTRLWASSAVAWMDEARATGGWESGHVTFVASLPPDFLDASPWRAEKGALWDVGPHALSVLERVLGPVTEVSAIQGVRDLVRLNLRHSEGATSAVELTLTAPESAYRVELGLWGQHGRLAYDESSDAVAAAGNALAALAHQARTGEQEPVANVRYAAHVTDVLTAAAVSIAEGSRAVPVV